MEARNRSSSDKEESGCCCCCCGSEDSEEEEEEENCFDDEEDEWVEEGVSLLNDNSAIGLAGRAVFSESISSECWNSLLSNTSASEAIDDPVSPSAMVSATSLWSLPLCRFAAWLLSSSLMRFLCSPLSWSRTLCASCSNNEA